MIILYDDDAYVKIYQQPFQIAENVDHYTILTKRI